MPPHDGARGARGLGKDERRTRTKEGIMLKRCVAGLLPLITLAIVAPAALASSGPSGSYKATISKPATIAGTWTIKFASGHDTDYLNGKELASGTYTISGSTIKFAQPPVPKGSTSTCRSAGKYTFKISGNTLKFTKISDPCNATRAEILAPTYTKV
jgi:hypothetical protein